jgi:hypothetical protein
MIMVSQSNTIYNTMQSLQSNEDFFGVSFAVCGTGIGWTLQVQYIGNGSCLARLFINGALQTLSATQASCQATIFPGSTCRTLNGNLYLFVTNSLNLPAATYQQPRFDIGLPALGVGSLETIEFVLSLVVDHTPNAIPVPLAPVFLATLRNVFTIQVIESIDFSTLPDVPPPVPRLVGLPGLVGVRRIIAPPGSGFGNFTTLRVQGTALNDLTSFAGLTCSPNNINITDNFAMDSLNGLNGLATWTGQFGPNIVITGNNFTGTASVSALSILAGCPNTVLLEGVFFQIEVTGCATIRVSFCKCVCACLMVLFSKIHAKDCLSISLLQGSSLSHFSFAHFKVLSIFIPWL